VREKMESGEIVKSMLKLANDVKAQGLIVEGGQIFRAGLLPELKKQMQESGKYYPIHETTPITDKEARARPLQGRMQLGRVLFRDTEQYKDFILPEFMSFPSGRYKDIVDACAWFAIMLHELAIPLPPEKQMPIKDYEIHGTHAFHEHQSQHYDKEADKHRPGNLFGKPGDKAYTRRFKF